MKYLCSSEVSKVVATSMRFLMKTVKEFMTTSMKAVDSTTRLSEAFKLMHNNHIRHLPVVDGDKLVGIVSDRDLLSHASKESGTLVFPRQAIETVMSKNLVTCSPSTSYEDALKMVLEHGINSLPVVDNGVLVGLVTSKDLLNNLEIAD